MVTCVAAAIVLTSQQQEKYSTEASIQLRDTAEDVRLTGRTGVQAQNLGIQATQTASLVDSVVIAARVKRRLRSPLSIKALRGRARGDVELATYLIVVTATDRTGAGARTLADAFAREVIGYVNEQQKKLYAQVESSLRRELRTLRRRAEDADNPSRGTDAGTVSLYRQEIARLESLQRFSDAAEIVQPADTPRDPVSPRPVRNAVIALLLGLALAFGYAFGRNALDRRLRGVDEVRRELDLPLLGLISADGLGGIPMLGTKGKRTMPVPDVEAARIIRTNLQYLDVDAPPKVVAVTSALPGEGKSTVAGALATASALAGQLTLLIECDLRRPSLSDRIGINRTPGLTDYLAGNATPEEILQVRPLQPGGADGAPQEGGPALVCIAAGVPVPRPAELLGSKRMRELLAQVREAYDFVVLDTSPVLPVVDTLGLLPQVDGIALCVRSEQTTREQVRALRSALANLPERPTGLIVTGVRRSTDETYSYYSYAYAGTAE